MTDLSIEKSMKVRIKIEKIGKKNDKGTPSVLTDGGKSSYFLGTGSLPLLVGVRKIIEYVIERRKVAGGNVSTKS